MRRNSLRMFEHDMITRDDPCFELSNELLKQIERFNHRMREREGFKPKILDVAYDSDREPSRIRSSSYVGVVKIGKWTIQILPKIARKGSDSEDCQEATFRSAVGNLLFMLSFTKRLPIKEVDLSHLTKVNDDFFEFLISLFVKNTLELLQRNMFKEYIEREENVVFLRGKIKFSSHIKRNAALKHRFYAEFDDLSVDNPLNRVLKYSTYLLLGLCDSFENRKKLQEIYFILDEVSLRLITPEYLHKIQLTRLNKDYELVLNLCKLIIEQASLELRAGHLDMYSFVFDMDKLFEEFIGEFIRRSFAGEFYNITLQKPVKPFARKYVNGVEKDDVLPLTPDVVLQRSDEGSRLIVDTKYKELTDRDKKEGAAPSDIYQMYAYSRKYRSPDVIMIYPQFRERKREADFQVGDGTTIYVRTVNVCRDLRNKDDRDSLREELAKILSIES